MFTYIKILLLITLITYIKAADYEGSGDTTIVGPIDSTTAVPDIGVGAEEGGDGSGDGGEGDHDYEDNTRCSVDEFMQTLTPADYDQSYNISRARTVHTFNETIARIVRLDELAAKFGKDMQYAINVRFMEIMYRVKISPQCVSALYGVVNGLSNGEWWAFDYIDSFDTSLLPIGLTQGSLNTYGNYEQCLDVKSPATTGIPFTGKYCFVKVITPYDRENRKIKPFITNSTHEFKHYLYGMSDIINDYIRVFNGETNRMGVCVPSTCQPSELQEAINEVQFPLTRFPIEMNDIECTTRDEPKAYLTSQLVSIIIFAILLFIVLIASVIELYYIVIKNPIKSGAVLQLSIISNTHTLVNGAPKQFTSVEMIRVLATLWIFVYHCFYLQLIDMYSLRGFLPFVQKMLKSSQYFYLHQTFMVEMFTMITGFIASYKIMGKLGEKCAKFNYTAYILKVYIRALVLMNGHLLLIHIIDTIGEGPHWKRFGQMNYVKNCDRLFDNYILHIQNYPPFNRNILDMCSPYAYYLCVHIHLSILAPLLVYSLHKKPKFGVLINILVILSGCFACIYPYIMEGQTPLHKYYNMIDNPGNFKGIDDLINGVPLRQLYRTEIYLVAFPMGILAGFLTRKYPNILANTNWGSIFMNVIICSLSVMTIVWNECIIHSIFNGTASDLSITLYNSAGRVLWSAGVCWLFYLTANGRAAFLNQIFKERWLLVLAKLSPGIYMFQYRIIMMDIRTRTHPDYYNQTYFWKKVFFQFMTTCAVAYIYAITVQSVANYLIEIVFGKSRDDNYDNNITSNNHEPNNNNNINNKQLDEKFKPDADDVKLQSFHIKL